MRLNRIYNVCDIFKTHLNTNTSSLLQSPDSIISLHVSSPLTWIFFPVSFGCQCSCFPLKCNFYDIYSSITSTVPGGRKTDSVWRIRIPQTEQSSFTACNNLRFSKFPVALTLNLSYKCIPSKWIRFITPFKANAFFPRIKQGPKKTINGREQWTQRCVKHGVLLLEKQTVVLIETMAGKLLLWRRTRRVLMWN